MNKPILLVPMAGLGKRFRDKGYKVPKQFVIVDDKQIIDYSFNSIDVSDYQKIIFIVLKEYITNFHIDEILKSKFGNSIEIVVIDELTDGSVCSCLAAKSLINNENPLVIYTLDVHFSPVFKYDPNLFYCRSFVLTFQSNSPNYSYAELDENGDVIKTEEKKVISNNALVGIYGFVSGALFVSMAEKMIADKLKTNNEYYIAPLYNLIIGQGHRVLACPVEQMHVIGTPEEMVFFRDNVSNRRHIKPIALCSDHSGFELKQEFKKFLDAQKIQYIDFGTYTHHDCDYVDYVESACGHITKGICNIGFGFCRSGQGINMAANKIKGIRGGLVFNEYMAEYSVRHNCANFFSIPSKFVDLPLLTGINNKISASTFDGGRHSNRVAKIDGLYEKYSK